MGQANPGWRRLDHLGLRWKVSRRIGIERGRDSLEVSLYRLVNAFGQSKIRDRVIDVEQSGGLVVDRLGLARVCARQDSADRGLVGSERVSGVLARADLFHQLIAIHYVASFDGFDRNTGRRLGGGDRVRSQRKG